MALADQLNQAKNNALQSGTQSYTAPQLNTMQYDTSNLGSNLGAINDVKTSNVQSSFNPNLKTVYASGTDLANAHNVYGNTVNYGDVNNPNLKPGDIIAGGSAVTPNITDAMISQAGAQRVSGNTANETLGAMQTNSKTTLPQYYQNRNDAILAGSNYDKLALNDITSGYKNQLQDALTNSQYHDINYNTVGMNNSPYTNAINNSLNGANSQATAYQNAIQQALNSYNGTNTSTANKGLSQDEINSQLAQLKKNYAIGNINYDDAKAKYNSIVNSGNSTQNSINQSTDPNSPQSNADYIKNMTDKINSLYNTQKNNVDLYYEPGKKQAEQQYQGLRNQASVTDQQNLNRLKESMAQQGLFNSGDNITAQTGINNQYAGNLAGYNQQEQNYYDTVNNQIAQQKANYDTQQAQSMMDLYNNADSRSFKLADLNNNQKQQAFQNALTAINAQYGMGQDQFGNVLKGTTTTYGMGRDNVEDQKYNNDTAMKADQINYGRNQDQFNNALRAVGQMYGMDNDQVQNLLNYAKFNQSQDQRQFDNSMNVNKSNSGLTQQQTDNSYRQAQADTSNNQFNQTLDFQKQQEADKVDYQNRQLAQALQLAQMSAASRGGSGGGGGRSSGGSRSSGASYRRSSGGSSGSSSSDLSQDDERAANDAVSIANMAMSNWNTAILPGAALLPGSLMNAMY